MWPGHVYDSIRVVGEDVNVFGAVEEVHRISPSELSAADVLVLDVEGAEIGILDGLGAWPETVIVEIHPALGAPTETELGRLERCMLMSRHMNTSRARRPKNS